MGNNLTAHSQSKKSQPKRSKYLLSVFNKVFKWNPLNNGFWDTYILSFFKTVRDRCKLQCVKQYRIIARNVSEIKRKKNIFCLFTLGSTSGFLIKWPYNQLSSDLTPTHSSKLTFHLQKFSLSLSRALFFKWISLFQKKHNFDGYFFDKSQNIHCAEIIKAVKSEPKSKHILWITSKCYQSKKRVYRCHSSGVLTCAE